MIYPYLFIHPQTKQTGNRFAVAISPASKIEWVNVQVHCEQRWGLFGVLSPEGNLEYCGENSLSLQYYEI